MKNGWQYVDNNGTSEKMAPMTLVDNVLMSENGPSLREGIPSNPNLLINGDFQVWQRGTSFAAAGYTADRWRMSSSTYTVSKNGNAVQLSCTDNWQWVTQYPEFPSRFSGLTLTVSVKIASTNDEALLGIDYYRDGVRTILGEVRADSGFTGIISTTISAPELLDTDLFRVYAGSASIDNTSATIILDYIKLENGTMATPNAPRTFAEELAMCQRYYENSWFPLTKSYVNAHIAQIWTTGYADIRVNYQADKRIVPDVTVVPEGSNASVYYYATNATYYQAASHSVLGRGGVKGEVIRFAKSASDTSTWTPGQSIQGRVHWEADAEIY